MAETMRPGYNTEYADNFNKLEHGAGSWDKSASGLFDGKAMGAAQCYPSDGAVMGSSMAHQAPLSGADMMAAPPGGMTSRDPAIFESQKYPSVFRETIIRKDDRGKYIDPFKNIANKPYGRRLMYDDSHPDKMYASQWSSELADHQGCYSFPTTTGLQPDIPFRQDLQWQAEGEEGAWPTDLWKTWTQTACCPPYDGHDDQLQYSQYKVPQQQ